MAVAPVFAETRNIAGRFSDSVVEAYNTVKEKVSHTDTAHLMGDASDYVRDKWHAVTEKFGAKPEPLQNVLRWADKYDVAGMEDKHNLPHGTILAIVDNESRGREGLYRPKERWDLHSSYPVRPNALVLIPMIPNRRLKELLLTLKCYINGLMVICLPYSQVIIWVKET